MYLMYYSLSSQVFRQYNIQILSLNVDLLLNSETTSLFFYFSFSFSFSFFSSFLLPFPSCFTGLFSRNYSLNFVQNPFSIRMARVHTSWRGSLTSKQSDILQTMCFRSSQTCFTFSQLFSLNFFSIQAKVTLLPVTNQKSQRPVSTTLRVKMGISSGLALRSLRQFLMNRILSLESIFWIKPSCAFIAIDMIIKKYRIINSKVPPKWDIKNSSTVNFRQQIQEKRVNLLGNQFYYQVYLQLLACIQKKLTTEESHRKQQKQSMQNPPPKQEINRSQVIGSKYTGQVNYDKGVSFFSDYQRRSAVEEAKRYSLDFKDPDILDLKDKRWNASVAAPNRFDMFEREESHKSKLLKIKLGLTDWEQTSPTRKPYFQGTETRNDYTGWNVSTEFVPKQKSQGHLRTNLNALDNSIRFNNMMLSNYKRLEDRYEETRQMEKSEMSKNQDIIEDLKSSFRFSNPNASPTKLDAASRRMLQEYKTDQLKLSIHTADTQQSMKPSFRANLSPTQKLNIIIKYFHSGNYGNNSPVKSKPGSVEETDEEQDKAWSCCLNSEEDSRGCCHRIVDRNKMNLSSFTL